MLDVWARKKNCLASEEKFFCATKQQVWDRQTRVITMVLHALPAFSSAISSFFTQDKGAARGPQAPPLDLPRVPHPPTPPPPHKKTTTTVKIQFRGPINGF